MHAGTRGLGMSAVVAGLLAGSSPAVHAQHRVFIDVSGGLQQVDAFQQSGSFDELLETASFSVDHQLQDATFFDVGGRVRLWQGLAVGVSVSRMTRSDGGSVEADIPHPFFFDRPRSVAGDVTGLDRTETATHIALAWIAPIGTQGTVTVSAGPSLFRLQQVLGTRVAYTSAYPYDTAEFSSLTSQTFEDAPTGFHVGLDVTWLFGHVGVGAMVRYSNATGAVRAAAGQPVTSVELGGVQGGGGLRIGF